MSQKDDVSWREERDSIGTRTVPKEMYYGVHTCRALANFQVTKEPISSIPFLVQSLGRVKLACAEANWRTGRLSPEKAMAIIDACRDVVGGSLDDHFVVDVLQGGAGTSTNMNANEVIANRALEILGHEKGQYEFLHPLDDVNRSQSTNDVYPTAVRLSVFFALEGLVHAVKSLAASFQCLAAKYRTVAKVGRTQLQDAVPMSFGDEFAAVASILRAEVDQLESIRVQFQVVSLGGTADLARYSWSRSKVVKSQKGDLNHGQETIQR